MRAAGRDLFSAVRTLVIALIATQSALSSPHIQAKTGQCDPAPASTPSPFGDIAFLHAKLHKHLYKDGASAFDIPGCKNPDSRTFEESVAWILLRIDPEDPAFAETWKGNLSASFSQYEQMLAYELEEVKSFGLTFKEYVALKAYISSGYVVMNGALRAGGNLQKCYQPLIDEAVSGLRKIPAYKGHLYRTVSHYPGMEESHQVGQVTEYPAFTSTTLWEAGIFGSPNFLIASKNCRDIRLINPGESEVLCEPGTRFKVTRRTSAGVYFMIEEGLDEKEGELMLAEAASKMPQYLMADAGGAGPAPGMGGMHGSGAPTGTAPAGYPTGYPYMGGGYMVPVGGLGGGMGGYPGALPSGANPPPMPSPSATPASIPSPGGL